MPTFAQGADTERIPMIYGEAVEQSAEPGRPLQGWIDAGEISPDSPGVWTAVDHRTPKTTTTFTGAENGPSSAGFDWFEKTHVIPRSFDFGNLLSSQSTPIEVFNAFRHEAREWTSFVNNAGAGTELGGKPTLPTDIDALYGIAMTVDVSTNGDPFVDATLDFAFSGLGTIFVPIEIQRIVMWAHRPEQVYGERLGFLTNVYESKDGTEKRESLRKTPRQAWGYTYKIDEGTVAQTLENLLFDFHALTFGVPNWIEETTLTNGESSGVSVVTVGDTTFRDFREGGLCVILTDQATFDVLEIAVGGITSTTLTFTSITINTYAAGTTVFPLSPSRASANIPGARWSVNLQEQKIAFEPVDNELDIADLTAFSSYNSKLLLDNGNSVRGGRVGHGFNMKLNKIDGGAGLTFQDTPWDRHKRRHNFSLRAEGLQAIWEMRRMIHAIKGRFVSFYVPRDSDDLVPVANLLSASDALDVTNVGYAQFVRNRQPKNVIRVNFVNGDPPLLREILSSATISTTVEQLTVDTNWPSTITPAEISRIEFVEKLRFDTDDLVINYEPNVQVAHFTVPLKAVFE
tara:strand:- start:4827 stop:6545 length:1719 start_codon:yes stop_codon:yes gene_type:complete